MKSKASSRYDPFQPIDSAEFSNIIPSPSEALLSTSKTHEQFIWTPDITLTSGVINALASEPSRASGATGLVEVLKNSTSPQGLAVDAMKPIAFRQSLYSAQPRFLCLQKWEGTVLEVLKESFWTRLVNHTDESKPDEEAEFSMGEVHPDDRQLVRPGAVSYWNIGYSDSISGQRTRVSTLIFRRLPVWTDEEFERAHREGRRLLELFGEDASAGTSSSQSG